MTAAHCVGELTAENVRIGDGVSESPLRTVASIAKHDTADLAVLRMVDANGSVEPFKRVTKGYALGLDFHAYGFTENTFGENTKESIARAFKGHFLRFFHHHSFRGYTYSAGELSIPCPGGLSGGPVFSAEHLQFVYGVVTENLTSTRFLQSVEEIQAGGMIIREKHQELINYGVCVLLRDYEDWLREVIGPKDLSAST